MPIWSPAYPIVRARAPLKDARFTQPTGVDCKAWPVHSLTRLFGPDHGVVPDLAVQLRLVALWPGRDQSAARVVPPREHVNHRLPAPVLGIVGLDNGLDRRVGHERGDVGREVGEHHEDHRLARRQHGVDHGGLVGVERQVLQVGLFACPRKFGHAVTPPPQTKQPSAWETRNRDT